MSGPVPLKTIVSACLSGADSAAKFYDELSGGLPLSDAPEWMLQAEIAKALGKSCHFVTVETGVKWLIEEAEARKGGKPDRNKHGRLDIVVWSAGEKPRTMIEIKKAWDSWAIVDDAVRLRRLLARGGSLHNGIIVVYSIAANPETLERRFEELATNSETKMIRRSEAKKIDPGEDKSWLWSVAVFRA